jgi:hypothetical protein
VHQYSDPVVLGKKRAVDLAANIVTVEGTISTTVCRKIEVTTISSTTTLRYVIKLTCDSQKRTRMTFIFYAYECSAALCCGKNFRYNDIMNAIKSIQHSTLYSLFSTEIK